MTFSKKQKRGTTLVEILIYFAIIGFVLFAGMSFSLQIFNTSQISGNFQELGSNLNSVTEYITSKVQTADSVSAINSVFDNNIGTLSLNMPAGMDTPVQIYLLDGGVFVKEGANDPIKISSSGVKFNILRFHRVTYEKAPDQIIINAEIMPVSSDIQTQNKVLTIDVSVSLRRT